MRMDLTDPPCCVCVCVFGCRVWGISEHLSPLASVQLLGLMCESESVSMCAGGGGGWAGWMGNLHQSDHKSPRITEGTLQTVRSGRPAERMDQEEKNVRVLQGTT